MIDDVKKFNELLSKYKENNDNMAPREEIIEIIRRSSDDIRKSVAEMNKDDKMMVFWFLLDGVVRLEDRENNDMKKSLLISVVGEKLFNKVMKKHRKIVKKEIKRMEKEDKIKNFYGTSIR